MPKRRELPNSFANGAKEPRMPFENNTVKIEHG
jgi:hypothetical protein